MHSQHYQEVVQRVDKLSPEEVLDLIRLLNQRKASMPKRTIESFRKGVEHAGEGSTAWLEEKRNEWER